MKKTIIKPETLKKLEIVAQNLFNKYGEDVTNFSNFTALVRRENDRLDIPMAYLTYTSKLNELVKIIKNLGLEKSKSGEQHIPKIEQSRRTPIMVTTPESVKELSFIIEVYTDGTINKLDCLIRQPKPEPQPEVFFGLFDYNNNKVVVRNSRRYNGCNIRQTESIIQYFGNMNWFETWAKARLEEAYQPTFNANTDTPRDIKTLEKVLSLLEAKRNRRLF